MKQTLLNGQWNLKIIGKDQKLTGEKGITATIPGSVYSALLDNQLIDDPYFRDNELKVLPLMDNDFEFTTSFEITDDMLKKDGLLLRFDGVDTIADILVNGQLIGTTENMHRYYEFDLLDWVEILNVSKATVNATQGVPNANSNELRVLIKSPTKYIKEENAKVYTGGSGDCMKGFPHIRKAHCMFGWDWGPRIPDAGIFRDVSILEIENARIDGVYISQEHICSAATVSTEAAPNEVAPNEATNKIVEPVEVKLTFDVDVELFTEKEDDTNVIIEVCAPDGTKYTQNEDLYSVRVTAPKLWWPNGFGEQPLYTVKVILIDAEGGVLDTWSRRIGLRTMTINTDKDEWGECFAHEVNGVKVFAMGADYIPEDNLLSRVTPERTRKLLNDAVWANYNSIRVWGGGYFLDDYFYDICDELGLMVWQDCMFACASYELDDEFERNIREEIRQNIRRLRHHACIGIWSGNNEMETQYLDGCWETTIKQKADYTKIFEYIIPQIFKEEDPNAFYWPSSPSSGGSFDNPWDENRGDAHYWDVWHGEKSFTDYRKYFYRYLSEFGFQSFPSVKTIETFTEPSERNVFSYVMEMHQRNKAANGIILKYIAATYLYPKNFEMLVYTSQLLQADAIRYGVEHFRRNRGRCMGAVVWQLNDIWPVASWSSIDYYGRYKALHYAEKRMFAPVLISCEETGELTERPYCVMEPKSIDVGARLQVTNETFEAVDGVVKWALRTPTSEILMEGETNITVPALDGVWLEYIDFSEFDVHEIHLEYSFMVHEKVAASGDTVAFEKAVDSEKVVSQNTVLFTPPKHYNFINPNLKIERNGSILTVSADAYAKSVCIEGVDGEVKFTDNYFDMEKGRREIGIIDGNATQFIVKSVYDIA